MSSFRVRKVQGVVPTKKEVKRTLVTFFNEKYKKKEQFPQQQGGRADHLFYSQYPRKIAIKITSSALPGH